jgi:hypothetical protein
MKLFRNERFLRVARPAATMLATVAGILHGTHAVSAWRQAKQWKTTDPSRSDFHWAQFQSEAGLTIAALLAAFFAWQLFNAQRARPGPR